jgi:hypothetical protein
LNASEIGGRVVRQNGRDGEEQIGEQGEHRIGSRTTGCADDGNRKMMAGKRRDEHGEAHSAEMCDCC